MLNKIIATYHHSFAGGSKNTSRLLNHLAKNSYDINAICLETPQYFDYTKPSINLNKPSITQEFSDVIDSNFLISSFLSEKILNCIDDTVKLYLGVNLFPYGLTLANSLLLNANNDNHPNFVLHPVGSDIWQIGSKMKRQTKLLLENQIVTKTLTYSQIFANEICNFFNISSTIEVVPPILEVNTFYELDKPDKEKRRLINGFTGKDFIIHHHSSMRPVKCPEVILKICIAFASISRSNCNLIMSGPIPFDILKNLGIAIEKVSSEMQRFKYMSKTKNLKIFWTDLVQDVEYFIQMSDVELNASLHDSFNISLLESLGCGIPIISSNVVGIKEFLPEYKYFYSTQRLEFDELSLVVKKEEDKTKFFSIDEAVSMLLAVENKRGFEASGFNNYCLNQFSPETISNQFISSAI
jgi:glycosyltransferase involved in cell wall biosynthesis